MLDKYFGFLKIEDEYSVMESLVKHAKMDKKELDILGTMIDAICREKHEKIEMLYGNVQDIYEESGQIFEAVIDQIIQADFDNQKQYDLLRLYQRIENISGRIMGCSKGVLILSRIGGTLPEDLRPHLNKIMTLLFDIHKEFQDLLDQYPSSKQNLMDIIHIIEEKEHKIDHVHNDGLQLLYGLANTNTLALGTFRALENILEGLEQVGDAIEEAATSLEWLLIS